MLALHGVGRDVDVRVVSAPEELAGTLRRWRAVVRMRGAPMQRLRHVPEVRAHRILGADRVAIGHRIDDGSVLGE